ncbi:hypothetical protein VaNZ11_003953, partial [Volvox africanus]
ASLEEPQNACSVTCRHAQLVVAHCTSECTDQRKSCKEGCCPPAARRGCHQGERRSFLALMELRCEQVPLDLPGSEAVEINAGDLAIFPASMSCIWDVKAPIKKHYNFE